LVANGANKLTEDLDHFRNWLRYPPKGTRGKRVRAKSDSTVDAYLYTVRMFHARVNSSALSREAVEDFVIQLEAAGNSPSSIGRHIYALRAYFEFRGVTLDMGAPSAPKRLPRWLTEEEWEQLLQYAEKPLRETKAPERLRRKALCIRGALMVYGGAGLRLSEGCGLRREGIDPRGYIRFIGKGNRERIVPVEDPVIIAIQEWMTTHDSEWVFPGKGGGPLSSATMQKAVRQLEEAAGIKNIHRPVHMLRHTVGAALRKQGVDIRDIQDLLGHANISTTQIYTQMAQEELRKKLLRSPRFPNYRQQRLV